MCVYATLNSFINYAELIRDTELMSSLISLLIQLCNGCNEMPCATIITIYRNGKIIELMINSKIKCI
jgi:hypothetical protein